jgi:hypothetical protein
MPDGKPNDAQIVSVRLPSCSRGSDGEAIIFLKTVKQPRLWLFCDCYAAKNLETLQILLSV